MNLRQLEVFHAIMQAGSVTGAARALNISQPAVSAILKHCETQLKMPLFQRLGNRLEATPEARALFPEVAAIFSRVDSVARLTQDLVGGRLGTLSIAGAFPIANGYLAEAVASFIKDRPNVRVVLQSLTSQQVVDRVINGEAELGVVYEPVVNAAVETELLTRSEIVCVMREDCPLAARSEIEFADLREYPVITYLPHALLRGHIDHALSEAGEAPRIAVQVGLSLTGMMLAHYGAGLALVESFLPKTLRLEGLVWRPFRPSIPLNSLIVRPKDWKQSRLMDDFVRHLKQRITA